MISIWLQRSGGLNIVIGSHLVPGYEDTPRENPVLDAALHSETRRWKEVKSFVPNAVIPFCNNIPQHLPMLYSLKIDVDGYYFGDYDLEPHSGPSHCHCLGLCESAYRPHTN